MIVPTISGVRRGCLGPGLRNGWRGWSSTSLELANLKDYGDPRLFEVYNQPESLEIKSKNDGKVSREMKSTIVENNDFHDVSIEELPFLLHFAGRPGQAKAAPMQSQLQEVAPPWQCHIIRAGVTVESRNCHIFRGQDRSVIDWSLVLE